MSSPVVVRSARLTQRPMRADDAAAMAAIYAEPAVQTHLIGPFDEQATAERAAREAAEWDLRGYGRTAVVEAGTGRVVGRSGLHLWEHSGEVEVAWVLHPDVWGRGYATEMGEACLAWAFTELRLPQVVAYIAVGNTASERVASRVGMARLRDDALAGLPIGVFGVTAQEHARSHSSGR